jgi:hypothetical protein
MTPGRPSPPSAGEYPWARDHDRVDTLGAARSRNRIRFGSLWTGTRANSIAPRRRFLPTRTTSRRAAGT